MYFKRLSVIFIYWQAVYFGCSYIFKHATCSGRKVHHREPTLKTVLLFLVLILLIRTFVSVPVAARSKAWVCGSSLVGIASSNPARGMMFVSCEFCVLSGEGLGDGPIPRTEESHRLCVCH